MQGRWVTSRASLAQSFKYKSFGLFIAIYSQLMNMFCMVSRRAGHARLAKVLRHCRHWRT